MEKQRKFDLEKLRGEITSISKLWGRGVREKNIELLTSLYDDDTHYQPAMRDNAFGKLGIRAYWSTSLDVLEDITLEMDTLNGSPEMLYETGRGVARFARDDGGAKDVKFKYVNVWKRQEDKSYKVYIDTFNDIKPY